MATTGLPTTSSQMDDLSISCMPASASSSFSSLYSSSSSFPLPPPPSASFHPPVNPLPPLSLAPGPLYLSSSPPFLSTPLPSSFPPSSPSVSSLFFSLSHFHPSPYAFPPHPDECVGLASLPAVSDRCMMESFY